MSKKWQLFPKISLEKQKLFPEINPIILQLLTNRELLKQSSIEEFFNFDYHKNLHSPLLFLDMKKAVEKISECISQKKKIVVYGDYDADGICSSVILIKTLIELGAKVDTYIPHRDKEGYGLNKEALKYLAKKKNNLVITVDCGISNYDEVVYANQLGLEIIVTDHHHVPEKLPPAFAIINPKVTGENYPFLDLAGIGVTFKLIQALVNHHKKNLNDDDLKMNWEGFEKWLLDLVAIGTVADCVDLLGENRVLVKYGLTVLNKTRIPGLRELIKAARVGKKGGDFLSTREISFQIAPRLNAAGRINHANNAFQLLMSTDQEEAKRMAADLEKDNSQRQRLTEKIIREAKEQLTSQSDQKLIFILGKDWPASIIGLVAGRFSDEFNRPVVVVSEVGGKVVGSGRSIPAFNIIEILEKINTHFSHYGGHSQACGFTLKSKKEVSKFKKNIINLANRVLGKLDLTPILKIDAEVNLSQINWSLYQEIVRFAPFGLGNPEPVFLTRNLSVLSHRQVGQNGKHLKLFISNPEEEKVNQIEGIGFNLAERWLDKIKAGKKIDLVYHLTANQWNGTEQLQLRVIDLQIK